MEIIGLFVILFIAAVIVGALIGYFIFQIGEKKTEAEITKFGTKIARKYEKKLNLHHI